MARILLTGTYSSTNRGDAAMQSCMIEQLRRAAPDVEVVLHTPFPANDGRYYADVPVVASSRRRLVRATVKLGWAVALGRLAGAAGVRPSMLDSELRAIAASDLVIDLSGDMLTEEHGPHLTYSHFLPLLMAQRLGTPVFVCGQSIGPFRRTMPLARHVLRRAVAVTARESVTFEYLRSNVGAVPRLEQTADLAFLLTPAPAARVDEILTVEGVPARRGFLAVSVSGIVAEAYARHAGRAARDSFIHLMAGVLDETQERLGVPIVFIAHVIGPRPSKDDRRLARLVHRQMKRAAQAHVLGGEYRAEELKGVIGRAGAFLGARMHANIAALSSGVPVLAISYSHKTAGIMRSMGMQDWIADSRWLDPADLTARLTSLWERREEVSAHVRACLAGTLDAARRNVAIALELAVTDVRSRHESSALDHRHG